MVHDLISIRYKEAFLVCLSKTGYTINVTLKGKPSLESYKYIDLLILYLTIEINYTSNWTTNNTPFNIYTK